MAKELRHLDITHRPELLQLVDQVLKSNEPLVLQEEDRDVAIVRPLKRAPRRRTRARALTPEDSLFNLIGIGESDIPGGISGKKHEYFLESYRQHHR